MNLFNLFFSFCRSGARSATVAVVSGTSTALPVMAEVERGWSLLAAFLFLTLKCADDQGQLIKAFCTHVTAYRRHDFVWTCKSLSCFPQTEGRNDDDDEGERAGRWVFWSRKMSSRNWGLQWRDNCNVHIYGRCGIQKPTGGHASQRGNCAFDTNWERERG